MYSICSLPKSSIKKAEKRIRDISQGQNECNFRATIFKYDDFVYR